MNLTEDTNMFGEPQYSWINLESVTYAIPAFSGVQPTWVGTSEMVGVTKIAQASVTQSSPHGSIRRPPLKCS